MFGVDTTVLVFIVLAGFSAGAVAYAFLFNTIAEETNPAEDEEALALVREAQREQDQRRERKAWEGLGFGGVIRRESPASASTRREPTARSRFHATRK